jgi:outer membrane lipoprotein SlyB
MKKTALLIICLLLAGCSVKRPVLYPNAKLQKVGQSQAQQDIDICCRMAEAYLTNHPGKEIAEDAAKSGTVGAATGAAVGAVYGGAGRGAAAGAAAGVVGSTAVGMFRTREPSPTFMNFVNRCLHEKGYEPIGWE